MSANGTTTNRRTDREILNGSPIEVTFNGRTYVWLQRSRREQAAIREQLGEILGYLAMVDGQLVAQSIGTLVKVLNMILAFCEDNNADMADDINDIEDYIKGNGAERISELIQDVYMPLFKEWLQPWIMPEQADTKKKKSNPTSNPKSTK